MPGIFFDYLKKNRRPDEIESNFRELGRIILSSMFFSSLGAVVVLIVRGIFPASMLNPKYFLSDGSSYFANHYVLVVWTFIFEEIVALLTVYLANLVLLMTVDERFVFTRLHAWESLISRNDEPLLDLNTKVAQKLRTRMRDKKSFKKLNHLLNNVSESKISPEQNSQTFSPIAIVTLTNRNELIGFPVFYSNDAEMDSREIILKSIDDVFFEDMPEFSVKIAEAQDKWERIYIPVQSILTISVFQILIPPIELSGQAQVTLLE